MTAADTGRRTRLQRAAVLVLAVGLGVSGFLFWRAAAVDPADDATLREQEQSRAYELAMQKNVGPVGLLMSRWSERLGSPTGVAVEAALAAALAAGACLFLAAHPPPGGE